MNDRTRTASMIAARPDSARRRQPALWVAAACALAPLSPVSAQLSNDEAPIVVSHFHLNVMSVAEHLRFWVDTLGGEAFELGDGTMAVRFPDVLVALDQQPPTGPTRGTTFDHIGFAAPDVPALAARIVENGYERTVGREPGPGQDASPPTAGNYGRFEYLVGPDGVKIELVTAQDEGAPPLAFHHVHFVNREFVEMGRWYINALNATEREGQTDFFFGADLPGVGYMLNFFSWLPEADLVGTAGRAVDHVGFDVHGLEAFCAELEARGIELAVPYHVENGLGSARVIDPWGTVIELSEGLRDVY
ncbi:MAG TPA: VOC family protein [Gammaproteobacteria bacterium]|nr:VOC family protein [Gammaproteobacteria bacterium]